MDTLPTDPDHTDLTQSLFGEFYPSNDFDLYLNFSDEHPIDGLGIELGGPQPNEENGIPGGKPPKTQRPLLPRNVSEPVPAPVSRTFEANTHGAVDNTVYNELHNRLLTIENTG